MTKRRAAAALGALLAAGGCAHVPPQACPSSPRAEAEIEQAVHAMYDALRAGDTEAFRRVTTDRFYSFDGGARFDGTALVDAVNDARAKGAQMSWSVGPLDTQRQCAVAWTQWVNTGSAGLPPKVQPTRWLESAVLVHRDGAWKIDFFHAHRAED